MKIGDVDSVLISDKLEIENVISNIQQVDTVRILGNDQIDVRICCFIYSDSRNIIKTISFGHVDRMMINDVLYVIDNDLLKVILE